MAQFKAFAPGTEVNGESVLSVVAGMGSYAAGARKILAEAGIAEPRAGAWYPQQAWLDAFERISEQLGPNTLFSVGRCIPDNAKFPPAINSVETALAAIDQAYHMNHRGGNIGSYKYNKTGDRSATVRCEEPYPCDFDRGLITGTATKFKPAGGAVKVTHDDGKPCRKKGADSCTYTVTW